MADDLDDLLDEVEDKFCKKQTSKSPKILNSISSQPRSKKSQLDDDISAIIDDVDDEEPEPTMKNYPSTTTNGSDIRGRSQSSSRKCFPVYLGASSDKMGAGSSVTQRSCNQLRCTSCDFKVVFYDDYSWHSTCDYLFLRNNVPDFQKLKAKLKKERGTRAYACQCSWRSIKNLVDLSTDNELHWVCGKHTT